MSVPGMWIHKHEYISYIYMKLIIFRIKQIIITPESRHNKRKPMLIFKPQANESPRKYFNAHKNQLNRPIKLRSSQKGLDKSDIYYP